LATSGSLAGGSYNKMISVVSGEYCFRSGSNRNYRNGKECHTNKPKTATHNIAQFLLVILHIRLFSNGIIKQPVGSINVNNFEFTILGSGYASSGLYQAKFTVMSTMIQ